MWMSGPASAVSITISHTETNQTDEIVFSGTGEALEVAIGPASLTSGSATITLTDTDGDGTATLMSVGFPVYLALIDRRGFGIGELFAPPYSLVVTAGGSVADTQSFGVFPGSVPSPAVTSEVALFLEYSLSPGDSVTIEAVFSIIPVPEGGGLGLIATGAAGVWTRSRRRARSD
jgi:hypothetical protein